MNDILPRVEKALRELQAQGSAGKTLANYAASLKAFCAWCIERGYLAEHPLAGLADFGPPRRPCGGRLPRRSSTASSMWPPNTAGYSTRQPPAQACAAMNCDPCQLTT